MAMEGVKSYKITELEKLENLNYRTIKRRKTEYIPIIFENALARVKHRRGEQETPYSVRYIRVKDIEKYQKGE